LKKAPPIPLCKNFCRRFFWGLEVSGEAVISTEILRGLFEKILPTLLSKVLEGRGRGRGTSFKKSPSPRKFIPYAQLMVVGFSS
jgi:hypothetical protein